MTPPKWEELDQQTQRRFSSNGRISVLNNWMNNTSEDTEFTMTVKNQFTQTQWETNQRVAKERGQNYYFQTDTWLYEALNDFSIAGKEVLVFGSTNPFYEAVALEFGAAAVTISEYDIRPALDPRLTYVKPGTLTKKFPAAFSISSFEHSGLGRYGDPINPIGDLEAMDEAASLLEDDGLLFLAVPVGTDVVIFNERRHYGVVRFPQLLRGWKTVKSYGMHDRSFFSQHHGDYQPVFVLQKQ